MPRAAYNPANWYWVVAGSATQVYSSASGGYVPVGNATYVEWSAHGIASKIDSEQSLTDVLVDAGLPGVPSTPSASSATQDHLFSEIPLAVQRWAFAIDNRVRVLEGQSTRSAAQFKAYVKSLL